MTPKSDRTNGYVFHYYTGEAVQLGDHIREHGRAGVVIDIMQPGSEGARAFGVSAGGVLIKYEGSEYQHSGILMTLPDGIFWEDLELVCRCPDKGGL